MKTEEVQITEIKQKFSQVGNKIDLLVLLNSANQIIYGDKSKPFTIHQLNYYADPSKCSKRYQTFIIKKKSGSERQINSPIKGLKALLKSLNLILQCIAEPHRLAFGFVLDMSIVDNARLHLNKNYVYNIDLKDFFHSFDRKRVKTVFSQEPFNLSGDKEPLAFLLASLCTHPLMIDDEIKIVLPQGSPTSPTLTNILCIRMDRRLNGLAKKMGIKYSRYADDITFSSDRNIFKDDEFQTELKRIIEVDQLLVINQKKTRLQNTLHRQEVTGLTVNEKVNVQKRYVKQIRMWIHYWEKYGYLRAQQLFINDYIKDKGHIMQGKPNLDNVLRGKLDFLKMVKGDDDVTYSKLKDRFYRLTVSNPYKKDMIKQLDEVLNTLIYKGLNFAMDEYRKLKKP
jgi:RNA-directed DNA polymerase